MRAPHLLLSLTTASLFALAFSHPLMAEAVKDREGAVRQDRAKHEHSERWNYNDVDKAFAEAKKANKPVLLVLRCVPCLACMGMDSAVLAEGEGLQSLLDQFVCVRLINCNALDLARFQFDYDLSFSTLMLNADGTVYGRYGSWKHQKNSQETALAGYSKALQAALAIHQGYPGNKASLALKQPVPTPFKTPVEIPQLAEKYTPELDWQGKVVGSCVHCHMIGSALQAWHRKERKPMPESLIYPFPEPETIGLTMASEDIAHVTAVAAGSIAERAGLKPGDHITSLAGQPLVAIADLSWTLHRSADADSLACTVSRGGKSESLTLTLAQGWRRKSQVTERATIWPERGMALGGMRLEPAPGQGIGLKIKGVGMYGIHAKAKQTGFKEGDIITAFGSITEPVTEGELVGHLLQTHQPGDKVAVKLLRNGQPVELLLPMQ